MLQTFTFYPVGSGLIYAMVIGLWALVLLPMWLKSHDQFNEGRQVDRFKQAMSSLGKSHHELIEASTHRQISTKRAVKAGTEVQIPLSPAARRRRVLAVLGVLQVGGLIGDAVGVGTVAAAVPMLLIAGFLMLSRTQVRIEQQRRAPQQTRNAPVSKARTERSSFLRSLAAGRAARQDFDVVEQAPAVPTVASSDETTFWQPVQTVAPSYINAPAATAVPRAIDADGGWTGTAMVEAARAMVEQVAVAPAAVAVEPVAVTPVTPTAPGVEPALDPDATTEIPVIRFTA